MQPILVQTLVCLDSTFHLQPFESIPNPAPIFTTAQQHAIHRNVLGGLS